MKKLFIFAFILTSIYSNAQVGIGTDNPHASAQLDVSSTTKGALMPRLTSAQRTAIQSPAAGLLVYQTDAPAGFYYYTGSAWSNIMSSTSRTTAAGTIVAFAGTNVPEGWALCSGEAIDRTANADLFAAIGTTYGTGNGSTTFNLPDLRGRTVFGKDNMGGTAANRLTTAGSGINGTTLGANGGNQTVTLVEANLPAHNHSFTGTAVTTGTDYHTHDYYDAYYAETTSASYGNNSRFGTGSSSDNDNSFYFRTSSNTHSTSPSAISTSSNSHSHTVTAAGTISNTGSNTPFAVVNPGMVLNYIIKL